MVEQKHNNILDKYYEIWSKIKDFIGRNFNVAVIHDD